MPHFFFDMLRGLVKGARAPVRAAWMLGLLGTIAAGLGLERSTDASTQAPPMVQFRGCIAIRDGQAGPVCMMTPEAHLVVWVGDRACRELTISEGDQSISSDAVDGVQGGCQLQIEGGTQHLHSLLSVVDRRTGQPWTLSIDRAKPRLLERTRRISDRANEEFDELFADLRRLRGQPLDAETYVDIVFSSALAEIRQGNLDTASRELNQVVQHAMTAGYRSIALEAAYRRAELLVRNGLHDEARAVLSTMASLTTPGDSLSWVYLEWLAGLLDRAEERFDTAAAHMASAISGMDRVHDIAFQRAATPFLIDVWLRLDRMPKVEPLLETVEPLLHEATECQRALLLTHVAFSGLVLAESREVTDPGLPIVFGKYRVRNLFTRALSNRLKCRDDSSLVTLYQGLAWLEFFEARYTEAQRWLAQAFLIPERTKMDELELLDLEAQLAIAAGKGDMASRLFQTLDATSAGSPTSYRREFECRVAIGQLEAQRLMGQENTEVLRAVRGCIEQKGSRLAAPEVRWVARRAKAAGMTVH